MSGFASTKDLADKNDLASRSLAPASTATPPRATPTPASWSATTPCWSWMRRRRPRMAQDVIARIRTVTDKPVKHVVLTPLPRRPRARRVRL